MPKKYGGDGVTYTPETLAKAMEKDPEISKLGTGPDPAYRRIDVDTEIEK